MGWINVLEINLLGELLLSRIGNWISRIFRAQNPYGDAITRNVKCLLKSYLHIVLEYFEIWKWNYFVVERVIKIKLIPESFFSKQKLHEIFHFKYRASLLSNCPIVEDFFEIIRDITKKIILFDDKANFVGFDFNPVELTIPSVHTLGWTGEKYYTRPCKRKNPARLFPVNYRIVTR